MEQENLQDLLEIHFQKTSNGGGEVDTFLYNPLGQHTLALFEEDCPTEDQSQWEGQALIALPLVNSTDTFLLPLIYPISVQDQLNPAWGSNPGLLSACSDRGMISIAISQPNANLRGWHCAKAFDWVYIMSEVVFSGIPVSKHNLVEHLLYHFWLCMQIILGETFLVKKKYSEQN